MDAADSGSVCEDQLRSGFRPRDMSPDSVVYTLESNFSLFSSTSGSADRCSFASDVHDHEYLVSEISRVMILFVFGVVMLEVCSVRAWIVYKERARESVWNFSALTGVESLSTTFIVPHGSHCARQEFHCAYSAHLCWMWMRRWFRTGLYFILNFSNK